MDTSQPQSCGACGPWWRLPLLLGLVLAALVWSRGRTLRNAPPETNPDKTGSSPAGPGETVSLVIDFGDGHRKDIGAVAWHDGMTVADLLQNAPQTQLRQKGSGESTFLTAIDGVSNEGADGRNWMYSVNGQIADRSFAVYELRPGDQVLWTFGPRQ